VSSHSDETAKYFVGPAFEDSLYHTDNNEREKACGCKIMRSPHFYELTNDSWCWRAVGIPLDLIDQSLQGDIDILFAVRHHSQREDGTHTFRKLYRSFELKTSKVSRDGQVTSLKEGKFRKTRAQLEKLCEIGSPQVFLLEAFVVEAGFSGSQQRMPPRVRESVGRKYDEITRADYGYVTLALEQIEGLSEDASVMWPVATIKEARTLEVGKSFREIVSAIETYIEKIGGVGYGPVITYCYGCRNLTRAHHRGPYVCATCGKPLI
jgi:hypothetical protein